MFGLASVNQMEIKADSITMEAVGMASWALIPLVSGGMAFWALVLLVAGGMASWALVLLVAGSMASWALVLLLVQTLILTEIPWTPHDQCIAGTDHFWPVSQFSPKADCGRCDKRDLCGSLSNPISTGVGSKVPLVEKGSDMKVLAQNMGIRQVHSL